METTKRIKNVAYFISHVFTTPALIVHELCHILMCLFTWTKISDIEIKAYDLKKDFSYSVCVYTVTNSYTKNFLISVAPFFGALVIFALALLSQSEIVLAYVFLSSNTFMPSKEDYESIEEFKTDEDLLIETLREMGLDDEADELENKKK